MSGAELASTVLLSLQVALFATALVLVPGIGLGFALARGGFRGRSVLRTLVTLPIVLPPVAVGLVLLELFSGDAWLGRMSAALLGGPILLTWKGAVIAAAVMSFPLLVLASERGFASVPRRLEDVAASLGASPGRVFWRVSLPLALPGVLSGCVLAFTRALGEFGATTLVAGHVPGETETLSLAIYARIEAFDDRGALLLALVSLGIACMLVGVAELVLARRRP